MVNVDIDDSYLEEIQEDIKNGTNSFLKLKQNLKEFVDTDEFKVKGSALVALKIHGEVKIYRIKEVKS